MLMSIPYPRATVLVAAGQRIIGQQRRGRRANKANTAQPPRIPTIVLLAAPDGGFCRPRFIILCPLANGFQFAADHLTNSYRRGFCLTFFTLGDLLGDWIPDPAGGYGIGIGLIGSVEQYWEAQVGHERKQVSKTIFLRKNIEC